MEILLKLNPEPQLILEQINSLIEYALARKPC